MIQTIAQVELPVDEALKIRKHRILPQGNNTGKRICIITGVHGDELEGQYVCWKVSQRIKEHPECLTGIVDIYPAMNPFGIDTVTRGIPAFDLDMNRLFPGSNDGDMNEHIAHEIIDDLKGADLCIDIHASNIYLTEVPQIRINELHKDWLVPIARTMNVDFIWVHSNATVLASTLAFTLNSLDTPTLVVEMGVGMRITKEYGEQLTDGIFATMASMGIWQGEISEPKSPIVCDDPDGVDFLNAPVSGIFIKDKEAGCFVNKGDTIGRLVNPLTGELLSEIKSDGVGWLFTIREYPVVSEGSLMGRILKRRAIKN